MREAESTTEAPEGACDTNAEEISKKGRRSLGRVRFRRGKIKIRFSKFRLVEKARSGQWNDNPKPFVWTATVDSHVAKLARCRQTLEQIQPGCTAPKNRKR